MSHSKIAFAVCCAGLLGVAGAAQAAEINVQGFTNGCFTTGASCLPTSSSSAQTVAYGGLTYQNSTFNVTTAGGFVGVGAQGQAAPAQNVNNLGSFTLSGTPFNYGSMDAPFLRFDVLVSFTAPPGTTPGSAVFTDSVSGMVTADGAGGVFIDFNNDYKTFTFNGGSFRANVNDVSLTAGNTIALSGNIFGSMTPTSVPEPASMALLGAGLIGAGMVRRRRQS